MAKDTKIVVEAVTSGGRRYVDIRRANYTLDGHLRMTKKGLSIPLEKLELIIDALRAAKVAKVRSVIESRKE